MVFHSGNADQKTGMSGLIRLSIALLVFLPAAPTSTARAECDLRGSIRSLAYRAGILRDIGPWGDRWYPGEALDLTLPPTTPTSGASVFIINVGRPLPKPVAVVKVFPKDSPDAVRESQAIEFLHQLGLHHSEPALILKTIERPDTGERIQISTYAGQDVEALLGETQPGRDRNLIQVNSDVAAALAELHQAGPHANPNAQATLEYLDHELERLKGIASNLDTNRPLGMKLLETSDVTPEDLRSLQSLLNRSAAAYAKRGVVSPSVIHGDAHPGNFGVRSASPPVMIFDAPALAGFVDGHGDPMADVGRYSAGLVVDCLNAGFSPARIRAIQRDFIDRYFKRVDLPLETEVEAIRFHQLRFYAVVIEEATRPTLKIPAATRAKLIRYLLSNFH
jgi:hypothetical protein